MFSIISLIQEKEWASYLEEFRQRDFYYQADYNRICREKGDGIPYAVYYEDTKGKVFYPFLERDISNLDFLNSQGEWEGYKDIITPYYYGGPLVSCIEEDKVKLIARFREQFKQYCKERKIVSEFIRFHPMLKNYQGYEETELEVSYNRPTVAIDLTKGSETIWQSMTGTCRNRIRKARKNGLQVDFSCTEEDLKNFISLYYSTMDKLVAENYYYFDEKYFFDLKKFFGDKFVLVNVRLKKETIASAIMICCGQLMTYHLGASKLSKLNLAPNNLLFFEAACFGVNWGINYLHLGGGKESLLHFKKSFSPNGIRELWIGKQIHLEKEYRNLEELWRKHNNNHIKNQTNKEFFPSYRA